MAMADMDWDTDSAMEAMATAVLATAMARDLLTLRPMPTTAMADMDWDTDSAMEAMATAVLATAMARDLLTLRPMPTTAMAATDWDTDAGMQATAMVEPTLDTAMEVTVLVLAMATASKGQSCSREL